MDDGPSERESHLMCSMLTRVCRLFYVELLPRVFESVEFAFPSALNSPLGQKSLAFCKELNKDTEPLRSLARYIRTCTVRRDPHRATCAHISRALLKLVNLESLSLSVRVDVQIFKALESMKSLKKLCIEQCTFEAEEIPDTMQSLNLTHFVIRSIESVPKVLLAAISSPSLRVLEVLMEDDSEALYLIRRPMEWHLEELSVTTAMIEYADFATFLHKTPSIRTLSVGTRIRKPPYVPVIPSQPSSLPNLECLKCYPMVLPQLIPGRAVNHIHVFSQHVLLSYNPPLEPVEIAALNQSAAYLETLQIPLSYMMQLQIDGEHFRHLQTLIIEYDAATFINVSWLLLRLSTGTDTPHSLWSVSFLCRLDSLVSGT
jgi:hypothetical protein